eukprot:scaffold249330_cov73-Cyclotella_meneghiniana.AAC.7
MDGLKEQDKETNLRQWILQNGGNIHKSLTLCTPQSLDDSKRGIFTLSKINKGEELIRLPDKCALSGKSLPDRYEDRNASPWLRCLASLLQARHLRNYDSSEGMNSYLDSLPSTYESLLNWESWELRSYLAGTALSSFVLPELETNDGNNMHKRYQSTVVPYLKYLKQHHGLFAQMKVDKNDGAGSILKPEAKRQRRNDDEDKDSRRQRINDDGEEDNMDYLYEPFRQGCMCISTRAFHMQTTSNDEAEYRGPYLLPYIDLLNHAPPNSPKHVTTLQRDPSDGSFVMCANRDIEKGEEVCHSYDSGGADRENKESQPEMTSGSLNSAQLLQTFGFVDINGAINSLSKVFCKDESSSSDDSKPCNYNMTPAVLTKDDICRICHEVSLSTYPSTLRTSMENMGLIDEGWEHWELESDTSASRQKALDHLPDEILITFESPLSDDIITICSLNFLPNDAIDDLFTQDDESPEQNSVQLSDEVLEDYFLGKLVLRSIMEVIKEKMKSYHASVSEDVDGTTCTNDKSAFVKFMQGMYKVTNGSTFCWGEKEVEDLTVLTGLNDSSDKQTDLVTKFMYGLTVSLEERACLLQLKSRFEQVNTIR